MLVEIKNLSKSYGDTKALKGVNLSFDPGQVVGLFGPNGSGKTTLLKIMANLLMQYEGVIRINDKAPGIETKEIIAYLPDLKILDDSWKISYTVKLFKSFYLDFDEEKALDLLAKFGFDLNKTVGSLSKGNAEKLQLILILSRKAKIFLFDEPIAGVDPASREIIFNLIKENLNPESLVIISTHLIVDIESIVDHVVFINNGEVFLDKNKADLLNDYPDETIDSIFRKLFSFHFFGKGEIK